MAQLNHTTVWCSHKQRSADFLRSQPGQINTHFGGRGVYFADPDNHLMEMITTPYGSEAEL
jgi:catechol 2,3-dioxygenase-like lactoylglutathione lyase family enzyme